MDDRLNKAKVKPFLLLRVTIEHLRHYLTGSWQETGLAISHLLQPRWGLSEGFAPLDYLG